MSHLSSGPGRDVGQGVLLPMHAGVPQPSQTALSGSMSNAVEAPSGTLVGHRVGAADIGDSRVGVPTSAAAGTPEVGHQAMVQMLPLRVNWVGRLFVPL